MKIKHALFLVVFTFFPFFLFAEYFLFLNTGTLSITALEINPSQIQGSFIGQITTYTDEIAPFDIRVQASFTVGANWSPPSDVLTLQVTALPGDASAPLVTLYQSGLPASLETCLITPKSTEPVIHDYEIVYTGSTSKIEPTEIQMTGTITLTAGPDI